VAAATISARIGCYVLGTKLHSTKTFEIWGSRRQDVSLGSQRVLVKRLRPELAENPRLVEQFVMRAKRATRLHHEGIEELCDVVVERDDCCIVSEFLDGHSLREVLDRLRHSENALPVWCVLHLARKVSAALDYAHHCVDPCGTTDGVYHQDVSAENIILTDAGEVKLVDFGLSRAALLGTNAATARRWSDSGEFDLWAPHFGDVHTDIQGLGRVVYELLAGRPPSRLFIPPSQHARWVSSDLDLLLERLLGSTIPGQLTSMSEVRATLDEIANGHHQQVDASHVSGLLRLVLTGLPGSSLRNLDREVTRIAPPERPKTILPSAIIEVDDGPKSELKVTTEVDFELESGTTAEEQPSVASSVKSTPRHRRSPRQHDWDAAVDRAKSESQQPSHRLEVDHPTAATESFEQGLARLKSGDFSAAEAAWLRALELDPNHRLSLVNLKLLRRLRDSERPVAAN
jgi:serine/threonine protein kinase